MSQHEWTRGNHFLQGYGPQLLNLKSISENQWNFKYTLKSQRTGSVQNESLIAVEEISAYAKKTGLEPVVCLSGGIDSEFIAEIFKKAAVPFRIMTMRFSDNQNDHELQFAQACANRIEKKLEYFDVDPQAFYSSKEFAASVERYTCPFPMLNLQMQLMKYASQHQGLPILGSGECYFVKIAQKGWCFFEREIYSSLFRFVKDQNLKAIPAFFQWSPELILSFLTDPVYKNLYLAEENLNDNGSKLFSSLQVKHQLYSKIVELIPRKKYYGWEKFEDYETKLRIKLHQEHFLKFGRQLTEIKIPIIDFISQLSPKS